MSARAFTEESFQRFLNEGKLVGSRSKNTGELYVPKFTISNLPKSGLKLVNGLKRNASNPLSFKLVNGNTSRSLPDSLHPTATHQSSGIVIS